VIQANELRIGNKFLVRFKGLRGRALRSGALQCAAVGGEFEITAEAENAKDISKSDQTLIGFAAQMVRDRWKTYRLIDIEITSIEKML